MNFEFTEEQVALRETLRRFVARDYSFEKRREFGRSATGFSLDMWRQFAQLGVLALPFPESHGGLNGTPVDTMIVMETLGPALILEPYLPTVVLCGSLVCDFADEKQKNDLLQNIANGKLKMAFAYDEAEARYELDHVATTARWTSDGWILDGRKTVVLHGGSADVLIVSARTAGNIRDNEGISLFLVDRTAAGVAIRAYNLQDGSRAADITLSGVRVRSESLLGSRGRGLAAIQHAIDNGIAAVCADAVGVMTALSAATLEYLKTRKQFGAPIGRNQALQHRMVDITVAVEQARSMMYLAASKIDSANSVERRQAIAGAKAYIGQAARYVGQQAVQLHGAIGVTDEFIVSHWFKRLTTINAMFGDADFHLGRYSDMLLISTSAKFAQESSAQRAAITAEAV